MNTAPHASVPRRALTMAERLQAGTVWVNTYRAVSYLSPFGGYKRSGLGRESGQEMIKDYMQVKSVWTREIGDRPRFQRARDFMVRLEFHRH